MLNTYTLSNMIANDVFNSIYYYTDIRTKALIIHFGVAVSFIATTETETGK